MGVKRKKITQAELDRGVKRLVILEQIKNFFKIWFYIVLSGFFFFMILAIIADSTADRYCPVLTNNGTLEVLPAVPTSNNYHIVPRNMIGSYHEIEYEYSNIDDKICIMEVNSLSEPWGISMNPTFYEGHTVLLRDYVQGTDELKAGMIIVYKNKDNGRTMHRVAALYPKYVLTESDYHATTERVPYENVQQYAIGVLFTDEHKVA